jgi:hypothetical protein
MLVWMIQSQKTKISLTPTFQTTYPIPALPADPFPARLMLRSNRLIEPPPRVPMSFFI